MALDAATATSTIGLDFALLWFYHSALMANRKTIRLDPKNYLGQIVVFVTLCCHRRRKYFAEADLCNSVLRILRETAATRHFAIHAYCFMPDHLHLLVEGNSPSCDFLNFVKAFKLRSSRASNCLHNAPLWQDKFFDHILRKTDAFESVCLYIWSNPVRVGLTKNLGEFPSAGSFTQKLPQSSPSLASWSPHKPQGPLQKAGPTKP